MGRILKTNRWSVYGVLLCATSAISILIYVNFKHIIDYPFMFINGLVALVSLFNILYATSRRFYLQILKLKLIIINPEVVWNASASFSGRLDEKSLEQIMKYISELSKKSEVLKDQAYHKTIQADGMIIEASFGYIDNEELNGDDDLGCLRVTVHDYHAPYVESIGAFDNKVLRLLSNIADEAFMDQVRSEYSFKAVFSGTNPFLGIYMTRLPQNDIASFICVFKEHFGIHSSSTSDIIVDLEGIRISATSFNSLHSSISKHLALLGG